MVVLHEMAHGLSPTQLGFGKGESASHGRAFCRVFLELVRFAVGREVEVLLKGNFKRFRVKYVRVGQYRPSPQTIAAGIEALRNLRTAAAKRQADRTSQEAQEGV